MSGFLGTKANFIVDLIITISLFLPFLLLLSFYFASIGKYVLHKNLQIILIIIASLLVISLEIEIRAHGANTNTPQLKAVLVVHLIFAISSFLGWLYLIVKSLTSKQPFNFNHKKIGKAVFIGLCLSIISGWFLYFLAFVL